MSWRTAAVVLLGLMCCTQLVSATSIAVAPTPTPPLVTPTPTPAPATPTPTPEPTPDPPGRVTEIYTDHTQVDISITSLFEPPHGYMPLVVTINNRSGREHAWELEFSSAGNNSIRLTSLHRFTAPARQSRSFEISVPHTRHLAIQVNGPGVISPHAFLAISPSHPKAEDPVQSAISQALWQNRADIAPYVVDAWVIVDPDRLPSDWRSLSAVANLWLSDADWRGVAPAAKTAIVDWVATGGRLILVRPPGQSVPGLPDLLLPKVVAPRDDFGSSRSDAGFAGYARARQSNPLVPSASDNKLEAWHYGFGAIVLFDNPYKTTYYALPDEFRATQPLSARRSSESWGHTNDIQPFEPRAGLLAVFFIVYCVTIGPVNFVMICRGGKRSRLFWSIPVISIGSSLVLVLLIVGQDGLGGTGVRTTMVLLDPERHRAIVAQEQASRCGALVSSRFSTDTGIAIEHLPGPNVAGISDLRIDGNSYFGSWFQSRSLQSQWLELVRPSRARVELVSGHDDPPQLISSIDDRLAELYYHDARGQCWFSANVDVGQRVELVPCSQDQVNTLWQQQKSRSDRMQTRVLSTYKRPGYFFAMTSDNSSAAPIPTLASIAWQDHIIYTGPVVSTNLEGP